VVLYGYGVQTGIETLNVSDANAPVQFYNLSGLRLQQAPTHGFYILRQGGTTRKLFAK